MVIGKIDDWFSLDYRVVTFSDFHFPRLLKDFSLTSEDFP